MNFTILTRCNCGCDTTSTIQISAKNAERALEQLRFDWNEEERDVEVLAVFEGALQPLPVS